MPVKNGYLIKGKRALITGASRRLGQACARDLAAHGADIVIHYGKSAEEARALAVELTKSGVRASVIAADLGDPEQAGTLVARATQEAGPIDILINNASIYPAGTIMSMTPTELEQNIMVNAYAPLVLSRTFAKRFMPDDAAKGDGQAGVIVNFLDTRIAEYDRLHAAYHASKRMLADFTRMCALEFAPRVRVTGIAPGLILPPEGKDEGYFSRFYEKIPLAAHGGVEDITRAVRFLIESDFITGQVLFVDGGAFMKGNTYGF